MGVALLRGLFWVLVIDVPSPIDEIHHLGYIDYLASGRGIPEIGVDYLPEPLLQLLAGSPTSGSRHLPLDPKQPRDWGATAHQYEAVQPPLYYGLMVPAYLAGSPWGPLGSLYAVRLATMVLAVAAIPAVWALARRLFPERPETWAFGALLPATLQGFNANAASATNDSLVVLLAAWVAVSLVAAADKPGLRGAVMTGALAGAAMLTKLNAVGLFPVIAAGLLLLPGFRRRNILARTGWAAVCGLVSAGVVLPWFVWNQFAYGTARGGAEAAADLLADLQVTYPFDVQGVIAQLEHALSGFWQFQRFSPAGPGSYGAVFLAGALAALVCAGLPAAGAVRGDRRRLAWLALSWPLMFLVMLAIVYLAYTGAIVGRHTYPVLLLLLLFVASALALGLGRRLGTVALAVLVAAGLWVEPGEYRRYTGAAYLAALVRPGVAPVWEQPRNEGWREAGGVFVRSRCPVEVLGLGLRDDPPESLELAPGGPARLVKRADGMALYRVDPAARAFEVRFPGPLAIGGVGAGPQRVSFAGGTARGAPLAQIQCRRPDPQASRFSQQYRPGHPFPITYGGVLAYARAWQLIGVLLLAAAVAGALRAGRRPKDAAAPPGRGSAAPPPPPGSSSDPPGERSPRRSAPR